MSRLSKALEFSISRMTGRLSGKERLPCRSSPDLSGSISPEVVVEALATEYKQLREAGKSLLTRLGVQSLEDGVYEPSARQLDLMRGRTLVFGAEHDMSVLMDHSIFCQRLEGLNLVERCLRDCPPTDPLELRFLKGAIDSYFSLFLATDCLRGLGVRVADVISGEQLLMADINLSLTATEGLILATRMIPLGNFWVTAGAVLPIAEEGCVSEIRDYLRHRFPNLANVRTLDIQRATELQTFIVRTCLKYDCSSRLEPADPGDLSALGSPREPDEPPGVYSRKLKIGRNEPCPCGSGVKYKRCCGRGVR
ncbi:MAG: SEC-C metal-binding domain-containing protein [Planctomycetaceae bacterium]